MEKTFEYRIYPNATQRRMIAQTFGSCRWVYNRALGIRKDAYEAGEEVPSIFDCIKMITGWKAGVETLWLKEADSQALQQSLRDLDKAYKNFFRSPGHVGFPKFKSRRSRQSYRTTKAAIIDNSHIKLPKLGSMKARVSRPIEGRILSATIKQVPSGKYFVTFCCTDVASHALPKTNKAVGIDLGINALMATSDGDKIANPKHTARYARKLAHEQRRLSRKVGARKGEKQSNNYKKQKLRVARVNEKIANCRKDTLHKTTTALVNENQVICAESLRVKNMVRNHHLAKAISDAAFSEIARQLAYKADWYGRDFIQIDTFFPSSKTCASCGNVVDMPLTVRAYRCVCGNVSDRDVNAAKNILAEGLRLLAEQGTAGLAGTASNEADACGVSVRPAVA